MRAKKMRGKYVLSDWYFIGYADDLARSMPNLRIENPRVRVHATPTEHEKNEWARMAQDAYAKGFNAIGHRFSAAAALPRGEKIPTARFDSLMADYRAWLIDGWKAFAEENPRGRAYAIPKWEPILSPAIHGYQVETPKGTFEVYRSYQGAWNISHKAPGARSTTYQMDVPDSLRSAYMTTYPSLGKAKSAAMKLIQEWPDELQKNPRGRSKRGITRVSQATGARPSKRLIERRKKTLKAPKGYFANPKLRKGQVFVVTNKAGDWLAEFGHRDDAVRWAKAYANRHGVQVRVVEA